MLSQVHARRNAISRFQLKIFFKKKYVLILDTNEIFKKIKFKQNDTVIIKSRFLEKKIVPGLGLTHPVC